MIGAKTKKQKPKPKGKRKKLEPSGEGDLMEAGIPVQLTIVIPQQFRSSTDFAKGGKVGHYELLQGDDHLEDVKKVLTAASENEKILEAFEYLLYTARSYRKHNPEKNITIFCTPYAGAIEPHEI